MIALKEIFLALADLIGVNWLFRLLNRYKIRVLMYHGVTPDKPPFSCWTLLECQKFAWQMEYVKRCYRAQPASALIDGTIDPAGECAIITFDDGLLSIYSEAWPILKRLKLPALLFVLPGLSEQGGHIWADQVLVRLTSSDVQTIDLREFGLDSLELDSDFRRRQTSINNLLTCLKSIPHIRREAVVNHIMNAVPAGADESRLAAMFKLMTPDQIRQMGSDDLIEIAGHTDSHPILSTLSRREQKQEIISCLEKLDAWRIDTIRMFAYPNGRPSDFNSDSMDILASRETHHAVSSVDGLHDETDNPLSIKRIAVGADISRAEFKAKLSGLHTFLRRLAGALDK